MNTPNQSAAADEALLKYKKEFSNSTGRIHFNNAGIAPLAKTAMSTMEYWMQRFHEEGTQCIVRGIEAIDKSRQDLAQFLGAKETQLAFFGGTTQALSQIAYGLDFKPGDEIIT